MSLQRVIRSRLEGPKIRKIISGPLEDWLMTDGWNMGIVNDEDMALAVRLLEASKRNNIRHGRFGASSRGRCPRAQIYAFLGLPAGRIIDPKLQGIFNDGTFRHIRWQLALMKAGIATDVEVPFAVPSWRVSTSLDAENDQYPWMFELKGWGGGKSIATLKNAENIPHEHILQMNTCMWAVGWDTAIYVAESKGTNDWAEVVVKRDERIIDDIKWELDYLNECVEDKEVPPIKPDCRRKKGQEYKDCPYAANCIDHHTEGSPWAETVGVWPGDTGTGVPVGLRKRSSRMAR